MTSKQLLDSLALDDYVKPDMTMREIFEEMRRKSGLWPPEYNIDERDLAAFLKENGYNIVIDYTPVYKVGR